MANPIKSLRDERGLSLQALADLAGTTRSQIHKLETGERRLTIDWMLKLARALEVEPSALLPPEPAAGARPLPAPARTDPRDLIPIRSAGRGGNGQAMFLGDGPIGHTRRPSSLAVVRDAYAIYLVGDSMSPRYEPGWLLHVNPHKPPKPGRDVVVTLADDEVLVKTYRGFDGEALVLEQLNPPAEIRVERSRVRDIHLIVGVDQEG